MLSFCFITLSIDCISCVSASTYLVQRLDKLGQRAVRAVLARVPLPVHQVVLDALSVEHQVLVERLVVVVKERT